MMRITLRQLSTFEAVARLKNFSAAANEMYVSQPTVSKQIKALQEEVGVPLLEQIGKKVSLTEAGKELYATCTQWMETWGRFEQTIANLKGMKQGKLRISAVTTTKFFMPRLLGPFCSEYPNIDISLEVVNRDRLLERLANNEDDLYIMGVPPEEIDVEAEPFLDNPLVVLAPAGHPLANEKQIPFERLASEKFLMRERGSGTRITLERLFAERHVPLNIRMELGSNEAIKQAVAGGLGLALLSQSTLWTETSQKELTTLDVEGFPVMRAWYVLRPKGKPLSVVAEHFLEFLREHIRLLFP
ncbi:MAG: LysR family transcriptional regulator [Gammaproteobacteria bacterium]|nr:LysR family transcriptional regulator [Gammaproteobacteria bacterium]